jgi:dihydroorotase
MSRFLRPQLPQDHLITGGRVYDPASGVDEPGAAVWVKDGRIREILSAGAPWPDAVPRLDAEGCFVFPGLIDLHVHLRDPGLTDAEDIASGTRAAVAGGFTSVCAMPNTTPPPDDVTRVAEQVRRFSELAYCRVHCVAAATVGRAGREVVDVAACRTAGAVAFSDDGDAVADPLVLREALERCRACGSVLSDHCERPELSGKHPVACGSVQVELGCAGQPWTAETLQLAQGILLAAGCGARYHAQHLSSRHSVELLKWALERGYPVTAEVTVHHLALTAEAVKRHGADAKCAPPLRDEEDRQALLEGVRKGWIQAIVTDHAPHLPQRKAAGLDAAPFGVVGLETAMAVVFGLDRRGELPLKTSLPALTAQAAEVVGWNDRGRLLPGFAGDLTVFDPRPTWTVTPPFHSRSRNSPFVGETLQGRVRATLVQGCCVYDASAD